MTGSRKPRRPGRDKKSVKRRKVRRERLIDKYGLRRDHGRHREEVEQRA
jgi:hypothetical protein